MTPDKTIPQRQCMGCNGHFPKNEMMRVLRTPEGTIVLDETGKMNGRGAYVCKNPQCLKKVMKSGRLSRILDVPMTEEIYKNLSEQLNKNNEQ